jgi:hypothetical protein
MLCVITLRHLITDGLDDLRTSGKPRRIYAPCPNCRDSLLGCRPWFRNAHLLFLLARATAISRSPVVREDGDRFVVPSMPATVNVTGTVYNPNVFVYDAHRRVGDYLQLAGGSNRDADSKSAYVIRATDR